MKFTQSLYHTQNQQFIKKLESTMIFYFKIASLRKLKVAKNKNLNS